jgi:REP element-mobilizing transposase RayT
MTIARKNIVADGVERVYHCTTRCVRRAFLCGDDPASGQNFDHRKDWARDRLVFLSGLFAVDVLAYAFMDNHFHNILRTRPDRAEAMTDAEVARNWLLSSPSRKGPLDEEALRVQVKRTLKKASRVRRLRKRLGKLSWFMGRLNEYLARKANAEDGITGRFWEGRYQCRLLEGEGALLTCMTYVELNPVRAGMSRTPEESGHTSARERLDAVAAQARATLAAAAARAVAAPAEERAALAVAVAEAVVAATEVRAEVAEEEEARAAAAAAEARAALAPAGAQGGATAAEAAAKAAGAPAGVKAAGILAEAEAAGVPTVAETAGIPAEARAVAAAEAAAEASEVAAEAAAKAAGAPAGVKAAGFPAAAEVPVLPAGMEGSGIPAEVLAAVEAEAAQAWERASWLAPLNSLAGRKGVFTTLTPAEYFRVLDTVGRVVRWDKAGSIPPELAPILERLSLNAAEWLESVRGYDRRFRRVLGSAGRLAELARSAGLKWFQGVAACRRLFRPERA